MQAIGKAGVNTRKYREDARTACARTPRGKQRESKSTSRTEELDADEARRRRSGALERAFGNILGQVGREQRQDVPNNKKTDEEHQQRETATTRTTKQRRISAQRTKNVLEQRDARSESRNAEAAVAKKRPQGTRRCARNGDVQGRDKERRKTNQTLTKGGGETDENGEIATRTWGSWRKQNRDAYTRRSRARMGEIHAPNDACGRRKDRDWN